MGKNLKSWEEWPPHIEFAYNMVVNTTTSNSTFELVYGFNPLTPFRFVVFPNISVMLNCNGVSKTQFVKDLHTKAHSHIEKMVEQYANNANKGKTQKVFEEGDLVWVHLRKIRFPNLRKSKLLLRNHEPNLRENYFQQGEPDETMTNLEEEPQSNK
ncbi:hypothetical protein CR513_21691, partial [Mucuna pruriens]